MPKKLTKLRIDEIACVDRAANEGASAVLMKRHDTGDELRDAIDEGVRRGVLRGGFENAAPPHNAAPRAAPRIHKQHEETLAMSLSRQEELSAIVKRHGAVSLARHVIRHGPSGLSEFELTKMFTDGVPRQAGESSAQAFAKAFSANNERGELMRRANAVVRNGQWARKAKERATGEQMINEDTWAFGPDPEEDERDTNKSAYAVLMSRAEELHKRFPSLSRAQAFSRVYEHPGNAGLVAAERRANRPRVT